MVAHRRPPGALLALAIVLPGKLQGRQELLERQMPEADAAPGQFLHNAAPQTLERQPSLGLAPPLLLVERWKLPCYRRVHRHRRVFQVERRPLPLRRVHHGQAKQRQGAPGETVGEPFLLPQLGARRDQPAQDGPVDPGTPFRQMAFVPVHHAQAGEHHRVCRQPPHPWQVGDRRQQSAPVPLTFAVQPLGALDLVQGGHPVIKEGPDLRRAERLHRCQVEAHVPQLRRLNRPTGDHHSAAPMLARVPEDREDPLPQPLLGHLVEPVEEEDCPTAFEKPAPPLAVDPVLVLLAQRREEIEEAAPIVLSARVRTLVSSSSWTCHHKSSPGTPGEGRTDATNGSPADRPSPPPVHPCSFAEEYQRIVAARLH